MVEPRRGGSGYLPPLCGFEGNRAIGSQGLTSLATNWRPFGTNNLSGNYLRYFAAAANSAARWVFSQVKSGSLRPKCPPEAVLR